MMHDLAVSLACQRLLEENRELLNARFVASRSRGAKLSNEVWLDHLRRRVLPLVDRVHRDLPERSQGTLLELYDVSLELFAGGHFYEEEGLLSQSLSRLWQQTLPSLSSIVARAPRRVAGSLSNAVLVIANENRDCVLRWLEKLETIGPAADSVEQLLMLAQVAAWHAGLARFRQAAVNLARQLPTSVVKKVFEFPESMTDESVFYYLGAWSVDPWLKLTSGANNQPELVKICGGFRGFGGVFHFPPRVFTIQDQLLATDGHQTWQVIVDQFGHSFHQVSHSNDSQHRPPSDQPKIDAQGVVWWNSDNVPCFELANSNSQAFDGHTLAVTLPDSFHLYLIARTAGCKLEQEACRR